MGYDKSVESYLSPLAVGNPRSINKKLNLKKKRKYTKALIKPRKVWIFQSGSQKPWIKEGPKIQYPKEKGQRKHVFWKDKKYLRYVW